MKIYDISKFAYYGEIKPELNSIYVKHTESGLIYVATDSFRLIEIKLESEDIKSIISEGFYSLKDWSILAKETQKKTPEPELMLSIYPEESKKEMTYPDYDKIIPTDDLVNYEIDLKLYDLRLLNDFVKLSEKFINKGYTYFSNEWKKSIKNEMLYFEIWNDRGDSFMRFMLMPVSR